MFKRLGRLIFFIPFRVLVTLHLIATSGSALTIRTLDMGQYIDLALAAQTPKLKHTTPKPANVRNLTAVPMFTVPVLLTIFWPIPGQTLMTPGRLDQLRHRRLYVV